MRKEKEEIRGLQTACLSRAVQTPALCSPETSQRHKGPLLQEMVLLVALFVCLSPKTQIWRVNGHFGSVLCAGRTESCPTVSWAVWVMGGGLSVLRALFEGLKCGLNVVYHCAQECGGESNFSLMPDRNITLIKDSSFLICFHSA